jgi:hypothetical protein
MDIVEKDGIETNSEQVLCIVTYGTVGTTCSAGSSCGTVGTVPNTGTVMILGQSPVTHLQKWFLVNMTSIADPDSVGSVDPGHGAWK